MSDRLVIPEKTARDQRHAADPAVSAWVSANAGAGKTKVLTDRVLRLLLAGTPPGRILCLTFTKAAAANMAIRVFERLGAWVSLDDEALSGELAVLEGAPPSPAHLRRARRLFAAAVETPGGLKIDTIHAFCERLLHMAPFEANVPVRFAVLDEGKHAQLAAEATTAIMTEAASGTSPALAAALETLSFETGGDGVAKVIREALARKAFLQEDDWTRSETALRTALGLRAGETLDSIERLMVEDGLLAGCGQGTHEIAHAEGDVRATAFVCHLIESLLAGKPTDKERAESFLRTLRSLDPAERCEAYLTVFFTQAMTPRADKAFVTQSISDEIKERLCDERRRLCDLQEKRNAAKALARTQALFALTEAIHRRMEATKARIGALDFDDLITKTLNLLRQGDTAWVLYKLDRGIDHVLIDEAQDTNPEQWEILRLITEDFTSGFGAMGDKIRTLFAVGDPKQSIYAFQGAVPHEFETSRAFWDKRMREAQRAFADIRLTLSFRSAGAVLGAVDAVFREPAHFKGLSFDDTAIGTVHETARMNAPGLVELWPIEPAAPQENADPWAMPSAAPTETSPAVRTARRVARAVKLWTTLGDENGRIWKAGDILILVRKRGAAFDAVIRALKEEHVAVAGADRLDIGAHIAVMDLIATGRAALLPEDDLTLAGALKSPLGGLSEEDLMALAAGRPDDESLAAALVRHAEAGSEPARRARDMLDLWRDLARSHGPFGFFAYLLGPHGARASLVARLGHEAGDAIDAFLCQACQFESLETPSLGTFLDQFASASHVIKRDLDSTQEEVRVMTVHGAKGLEAGIVVVLDGCDVLGRDPLLLTVAAGGRLLPVWSPGQAHDCELLRMGRAAIHEKGLEEHHRLLYVAMTRAKDRLVIAPFQGRSKETPAEAWCDMIRRSLVAAGGLAPLAAPYGEVEVWSDEVAQKAFSPSPVEKAAREPLPDWLVEPAPPEPEPEPPLRPSSALAAADRLSRREGTKKPSKARLIGVLTHALLERLPHVPHDQREAIARDFVRTRAVGFPEVEQARIRGGALSVIGHPDLKNLFGPSSRAEAPVAGSVWIDGERMPISGQIDRLAIGEDEIHVADYKTSILPPHPDAPVPKAYILQLALYRALLIEAFDRKVRAFLIWTAGPLVRELTEAEMEAVLPAHGSQNASPLPACGERAGEGSGFDG